jgi:hypothetical protein
MKYRTSRRAESLYTLQGYINELLHHNIAVQIALQLFIHNEKPNAGVFDSFKIDLFDHMKRDQNSLHD